MLTDPGPIRRRRFIWRVGRRVGGSVGRLAAGRRVGFRFLFYASVSCFTFTLRVALHRFYRFSAPL